MGYGGSQLVWDLSNSYKFQCKFSENVSFFHLYNVSEEMRLSHKNKRWFLLLRGHVAVSSRLEASSSALEHYIIVSHVLFATS